MNMPATRCNINAKMTPIPIANKELVARYSPPPTPTIKSMAINIIYPLIRSPTKSIPKTPTRAPGTLFFIFFMSDIASPTVFSGIIEPGNKKWPTKSQLSSTAAPAIRISIFIIAHKPPLPVPPFNFLDRAVSKISSNPRINISFLFCLALASPSL